MQSQVRRILAEAFAMYSAKTEFVANVHPDSYRLFQAADLLCTVELAAACDASRTAAIQHGHLVYAGVNSA